MADARLKLPSDLAGLTRSEWELIVREARYSQLDAEIVRMHILDGLAQVDTATELDRVRMTISRRLQRNIYPRAREVALKLNIIKNPEG
jgi:hypothetical protein